MDDTIKWVIPAITLGYHVCNDGDGRFKFYHDDVVIVYRNDYWEAVDTYKSGCGKRQYQSLEDALRAEY